LETLILFFSGQSVDIALMLLKLATYLALWQ